MRFHKCKLNQNLRCTDDLLTCPLEDEVWYGILDAWANTGREAPALNWERTGKPNIKTEEKKALAKAEIARLFEFPERVQLLFSFGSGMTKWMCEDITRARFLWKETRDGITLKRAQKRWLEKLERRNLSRGERRRNELRLPSK